MVNKLIGSRIGVVCRGARLNNVINMNRKWPQIVSKMADNSDLGVQLDSN